MTMRHNEARHESEHRGLRARLGAALAGWRGRFRTALGDARERAALRRDLAELERVGELDRVLGDLGLSRGGIPLMMKNHPRSARLLAGMMARLGIATPSGPRVRARLPPPLTESRQPRPVCTEAEGPAGCARR